MNRFGAGALVLALLAPSACRRATPAPGSAASGAAASVAPSGSAPLVAKDDFSPDDELEPNASASAVALAPSPAGAASSERADRLRQLLRGQLPAALLPLHASNPGVAMVPNLYQSLTTEVAGGLTSVDPVTITLAPAVLLSGKMSPESLSKTRHMEASFKACYRRARLDEPQLAGKVALIAVVDQQGAVSSVTVEKAPPRSAGLQACLKRRVELTQFDSLGGESQAKLRLQLVLAPER